MRFEYIKGLMRDGCDTNNKFKDAFSHILALVSETHKFFESSKTDGKYELLRFVFANLQLEGATIRYTLRKSFE